MSKYSFEEIIFVKRMWVEKYKEFGLARFLSNFFSQNYILILVFFAFWIILTSAYGCDVFILLLPILTFMVLFILMLLDGIYSSLKVISILEICRKYVQSDMTLEDLYSIIEIEI
jgi:hypothetical protein